MLWVSIAPAASVGTGVAVAAGFISLSCIAVRYHLRFSPRLNT